MWTKSKKANELNKALLQKGSKAQPNVQEVSADPNVLMLQAMQAIQAQSQAMQAKMEEQSQAMQEQMRAERQDREAQPQAMQSIAEKSCWNSRW